MDRPRTTTTNTRIREPIGIANAYIELDRDNRIWWGKDGGAIPQIKRFLHEVKVGLVPQTMWFYQEVDHTQEGKKELFELVDFDTSDDVFITPTNASAVSGPAIPATGDIDRLKPRWHCHGAVMRVGGHHEG